jgi:hypothetical protein
MALTDNCDLYVAINENGINLVVQHIMRQRPSLFNYATSDIAADQELWCAPVNFTSDVQKYGNPVFTVSNPIPVLGADSPPVELSFCAQLTKASIDFHPGNVISLPSELNPPLQKQHFAMQFKICGAIGCPSEKDVDTIPVVPPQYGEKQTTVPPVHVKGKLNCFCLDIFVVGHFERTVILGKECLLGKVDRLDIVDIKPDGLEQNLVCYLKTTVNVVLRQKLTIPFEKMFFSFPLFNIATITLSPTPNPPVPNNPAVEDDQLKAFISMGVGP